MNSELYQLTNTIHAHDGAIRCITSFINNNQVYIVTGCQSDHPNIRTWKLLDKNQFEEINSCIYHDHWVTALTSLSSDINRSILPEGCIISGCLDAKIRIFDFNHIQINQLLGHKKGVISFSWTSSDYHLISGSWDGTARVWDVCTSTCILELSPHENGVQVLGLPNNTIATISTGESVNGKPANFKLRLWDAFTGNRVSRDIEDHQGSIRTISFLPGIKGFLTAGNDGTVILRSIDGIAMDMMRHPSQQEDGSAVFILDSASISTSSTAMDIVTCGEDGSVIVWRGTRLLQSIPHPKCVWTVYATLLPHNNSNGDFLTGDNDGVLRVFSKDTVQIERNKDQIEQLNNEFALEVIEANHKKKKGPSAEELAKAPNWDSRNNHPGKSEAQVMVFNKSGTMIAAQWLSGSWVVIGEVTGNGDGGSVNSIYYDHILPVEIETPNGLKTLKLGYNNAENPFVAAQRFIDENQLQQSYLSEIADWITSRLSNNNSIPTIESSSTTNTTTTSNNIKSKTFTYQILHISYCEDVPNMNKLLQKLIEFNQLQDFNNQLLLIEIENIEQICKILSETSRYHTSIISVHQIQCLIKVLFLWESNQLFPIFDILRTVCIHPEGLKSLNKIANIDEVLQKSIYLCTTNEETISYPTLLTTTKFLCNIMKSGEIIIRIHTIKDNLSNNSILECYLQIVHKIVKPETNKLLRVVLSRLLINLITPKIIIYLNDEQLIYIINEINNILIQEKEHVEVVYNSLLVFGTLLITKEYLFTSIEKDSMKLLLHDIENNIWKDIIVKEFFLELLNLL